MDGCRWYFRKSCKRISWNEENGTDFWTDLISELNVPEPAQLQTPFTISTPFTFVYTCTQPTSFKTFSNSHLIQPKFFLLGLFFLFDFDSGCLLFRGFFQWRYIFSESQFGEEHTQIYWQTQRDSQETTLREKSITLLTDVLKKPWSSKRS